MSRGTVNRLLIGLAGLLLLAGGLLVLGGGADAYRRWHLAPPAWWPLTSPDQPVLSDASRTRWTGEAWWWPVVVAVLVVAVIAALVWLAAQVRRRSPALLHVPVPDGEAGARAPAVTLAVRSSALGEAVGEAAGLLPGVRRARVRMLGGPRHPQAVVSLLLAPGTSPGEVQQRLHDGPLADACAAVGLDRLPADVRLRVAAHDASRVH